MLSGRGVRQGKSGKASGLAEGLANYMVLQYLENNLPLYDLIASVP